MGCGSWSGTETSGHPYLPSTSPGSSPCLGTRTSRHFSVRAPPPREEGDETIESRTDEGPRGKGHTRRDRYGRRDVSRSPSQHPSRAPPPREYPVLTVLHSSTVRGRVRLPDAPRPPLVYPSPTLSDCKTSLRSDTSTRDLVGVNRRHSTGVPGRLTVQGRVGVSGTPDRHRNRNDSQNRLDNPFTPEAPARDETPHLSCRRRPTTPSEKTPLHPGRLHSWSTLI